MLFICIVFFMLCPVVHADSSLEQQCQDQKIDYREIVNIFATLDGAYLAEQKYQSDSGKFYTINVLRYEITVDSFFTICGIDQPLPDSAAIDSNYRVVVSYKLDGEIPDTCTSLIICFFNSVTDNHMPIARLTYCESSETFHYEYHVGRQRISYYRE